MITLRNVNKIYQTEHLQTKALNAINLHVEKGKFISIMGPSGCGKSTLLNTIGLLDTPTDGEMLVDGQSVTHLSDRQLSQLRNRKFGFVFQNYHLIHDLPVLDNVELPLIYRNIKTKQRIEMAKAALQKVGLTNRLYHLPSQLSGGQRQRVAIARALVGNPEVILADEPTGNLDTEMGEKIMELLKQLNSTDQITIVMVTHDPSIAGKTDYIIRMKDGIILQKPFLEENSTYHDSHLC
ncbi:ABC transporter ATP-binding protein [Xanthocytophaga agilis]|uniref:ABC transporter ATP-binding protein n=1 Tax=Xanthocytophaga agilis TaxID=3048010 RepID=A0AAE3R9K4_9BACT|nr:ABC transporter ATP-binding protein [Xanthocytophaga agilis]MDJ1505760.1 ABC transporter ATP-binding protein [Xanthocytophaga agilis]